MFMASITSLKASDGTGNASVATVQSVRSSGATTLVVDTVQGINTKFHATMGTPHTFVDPVTSETITVISEATAVDFKGHVDGGNLEIDTIAPGFTDAGSAVNDIVIIKPTTQWADEVAKVLEVTHNDSGTLKDGAVTPEKLITGTGTSWDWQGWTPALTAATTNPNIGSTGVIDGRYRQIGKTVDFELRISSSGSGLSNGSGNYRISYPVTPNNNYIGGNSPKIVGLVNFYNASNTTMYQAKAMAASTSYMEVYFDVASSTNLFTNSSNIWSSSFFGVPTGNIVTITGRYEAD